jgi:hypothetical protein
VAQQGPKEEVMASNLANDVCIGQYQLCYIRVVRLNQNCTPATGADVAVISVGATTITASPELEEATAFEGKNGCGTVLFDATGQDKIKRWNLTGDLITFDWELMEIMFGGTVIVGKVGSDFDGKAIGYAMPGKDEDDTNGVSLEIWTKNSTGTGLCDVGTGTAALWTRHVFPRALMTPGDRTFEEDIAHFAFTGRGTENAAWGTGAFADYQGVGDAPTNSGYFQFEETDLPFDPDDACGLITAP